jgi:hydroxymethylpyrimidine pyrophosphatase-like HAD family hydrolase
MYKLIITDFDGSLVGKDLNISKENYMAISELRKLGIDITIATGRRWNSIEPFVNKLNIKLPIILYNGAGIYDHLKDKWLYRKFLNYNIFLEILEFIRPLCPKVSIGVYGKDELYVGESNNIIKLFFEGKNEDLIELEKLLKTYFNDKVEIFFSSDIYLEILPKGCSKGNAMLKLLKYLDISPKDVIAIGDHDNDIDMIKKAGLGITLSSGSQRIKEEADYVINTGPDRSLLEIFERFIIKDLKGGEFYDFSDFNRKRY